MIDSEIYKKYNINSENIIGKGTEALVYFNDDNTVLKIYDNTTNYKKLCLLKQFYESLNVYKLSYDLPYIYTIYDEDNTIITIEKMIRGKNMQSELPKLNDNELYEFMLKYLTAVLELRKIKLFPKIGGYQLFNDYKIYLTDYKDWNDFLKQHLINKQTEISKHLMKDVLHYDKKLELLLNILSFEYKGEYSLIHGDFYPGNLLVDDNYNIKGLLDFGIMTMYGDYLFDIATSWVFFDMYDELHTNIKKRYLKLIMHTLGVNVREKLYLYVLIYSIFSANFYSKDCSDGHYKWCIKNLNDSVYWSAFSD